MTPRTESDALGLWQRFLLKYEGSDVVLEPNGKYSRYGISHVDFDVVSAYTPSDLMRVSRTHWMSIATFRRQRYDPLSFDYFQLADYGWNAGLSRARIASQQSDVTVFISEYYEEISARPHLAKYKNGWHNRRLGLMSTFYGGS